MRPRYGVTVGHTLPVDLVYLLRRCEKPVVWILFYYCEHLPHFPEFADLMATTMAETRSTRWVSRITTVTHLRRCSKSSIRSKMWPSTYVFPDFAWNLFFSDTDGR